MEFFFNFFIYFFGITKNNLYISKKNKYVELNLNFYGKYQRRMETN